MKPFLLIRNSGLAPIESFTILGLSTARGEADKIGQFGSGSKHGILALLRAGITPRIFIGNDELVFTTHAAKMNEKDYQEVRYTFQGETHKTGMCLDFGALDWDSVTMALREFICNALDQGEKISQCTSLEDAVIPSENETRIFIQTDDVKISEYWERLREFFLHFDGLESTPIIDARSNNAQFFRRGVYVTERSGFKQTAIFAYNFQEGRIDESRNMDGAAMGSIAARLLKKSQPHIETIIHSFSGDERWEHQIGDAMWDWTQNGRSEIKAAWRAIHGDLPFCDEGHIKVKLVQKGIAHVSVPGSWGRAFHYSGVVDAKTLLTELDKASADECEATETAMETFKRAWRWIEAARLTNGKAFPRREVLFPADEGRKREMRVLPRRHGLPESGLRFQRTDRRRRTGAPHHRSG